MSIVHNSSQFLLSKLYSFQKYRNRFNSHEILIIIQIRKIIHADQIIKIETCNSINIITNEATHVILEYMTVLLMISTHIHMYIR